MFILYKMVRQTFKDFIEQSESLMILPFIQQIPDLSLIWVEQAGNLVTILIDVARIEHSFNLLLQRSHLHIRTHLPFSFHASLYISHFSLGIVVISLLI